MLVIEPFARDSLIWLVAVAELLAAAVLGFSGSGSTAGDNSAVGCNFQLPSSSRPYQELLSFQL